MKEVRWVIPLICVLPLLVFGQVEEEPRIIIEPVDPSATSQLEGNLEKGIWTAAQRVIVRYGTNVVLVADQVSIDNETANVLAEGNVTLQSDGGYWRGEQLQYNFQTGEVKAHDFKVGVPPVYIAGRELEGNQTNQVYTIKDARITTDDIADPGYFVRAKRVTLIPGKLVEADNATLYLGDVPVMVLPKYSRNLRRHPSHFYFTPGYRSMYGPYLLGSYRWQATTNVSTAMNLDYRLKRGVGFGPDVSYDFDRWGAGALTGYYTQDNDPGRTIEGKEITDDRYRIRFSHQAIIRTNLTATASLHKQSDPRIVRDFFETEYREDPQPQSFLEIEQLWPNFSLNLLASEQFNSFFQAVERSPDLKLTAIRQRLGVSPLFYEGETSAAYLRFQPGLGSSTNDYSAFRADTFHQLLLPQTYFGWLNFVPRVGGRFTHYGETEGGGIDRDSQDRAVFNTGAELSFKAHRIWHNARSSFWEVDGIRHIIQPSVNYVFVPDPTAAPRELPQFDTELQTLRLMPIDFPDFNAIDSIDSQNVLRLTLRNKVQTKRAGEIDNLLNWGLYTDFRIDPRSDQDSFADLFSDLDLKPRSWLLLSSEVRFDVEDSNVRLARHRATFVPNNIWNLSLGHWYFREDPALGPDSGNNLIHTSFYYRFNENWGTRLTHHYEAQDGVLEEQYYTIYRDLRSWTAALTFRVRNNRTEPNDYAIALTFSLKAFPRFSLGKDRPRHSLLLGG